VIVVRVVPAGAIIASYILVLPSCPIVTFCPAANPYELKTLTTLVVPAGISLVSFVIIEGLLVILGFVK
jgi:hypothetical protein